MEFQARGPPSVPVALTCRGYTCVECTKATLYFGLYDVMSFHAQAQFHVLGAAIHCVRVLPKIIVRDSEHAFRATVSTIDRFMYDV